MNDEELLELAIAAALRAGATILQVYAQHFKVSYKHDASPVTRADREASRVIVAALSGSGLPVISEEEKIPSFAERRDAPRLWLVDPLDGTKEFVKRNGEFSVNIALIENGYPVLGVIYMPVLNELYFAATGLGSYKVPHEALNHLQNRTLADLVAAGKRLPLAPPHRYTVVASRSHLSTQTYAHLQKLKLEKGELDIIYSGSSVKMAWVAEGKAHQYPRYGRTMEWDTAAGQAIVENAGGQFLDLHSRQRLHYNKENLENPDFVALHGHTAHS